MFGLLSEILLTFRQQWEENHSWCQVVMFILHVNLIRWWYPIIYQTPIYILLWGTFLDVPNIYFIFFNWILFILFFNFIILYRFCHISKWVCHRYTCVPHPEPSSLKPKWTENQSNCFLRAKFSNAQRQIMRKSSLGCFHGQFWSTYLYTQSPNQI